MPTKNGQTKEKAAFVAGGPITGNYRPSIGSAYNHTLAHPGYQLRFFTFRDIEVMRRDPQIEFGLRILRAPIAGARWEVNADSTLIQRAVDGTLQKVWQQELLKITRMFESGSFGGETVYSLDSRGDVEFECINDVHPLDIRPLRFRNSKHAGVERLAGVHIKNVRHDRNTWGHGDDSGGANLFTPRAFWIANEPEYGRLYGRSRLAGAWEPWMEKRGKKGAIEIRRLWTVKNVFTGGMMRHPMGQIETADGTMRSNQEYAREIVELMEAGGVLALPNTRDPETGNYLWEFEPAKLNGDFSQLLDYPKHLDAEILVGMGIPPEVVQAAETGSGWSGRSVPFIVFLTSMDHVVDNIIRTVDKQIIRPMVDANFGESADYEIQPISLVPKMDETEGQGQAEGQPSGGSPQSLVGAAQGQAGQPTQLSQQRAPAGGVTIAGQEFKGGEFIPAEILAQASTEEKAALESAPAKRSVSEAMTENPGKVLSILNNVRVRWADVSPEEVSARIDVLSTAVPFKRLKRELSDWQDGLDALERRGESAIGTTEAEFRGAFEAIQQATAKRAIADMDIDPRAAIEILDNEAVPWDVPTEDLRRRADALSKVEPKKLRRSFIEIDDAEAEFTRQQNTGMVAQLKMIKQVLQEAVAQHGLQFDDNGRLAQKSTQLAQQHAPEGGATVGGTFFPGGRFIPPSAFERETQKKLHAITERSSARLDEIAASVQGPVTPHSEAAILSEMFADAGSRLPQAIKETGMAVVKAMFALNIAAEKAVQAVAQQRGLPEDKVQRLVRLVTVGDAVAGMVIPGPPASMAYLIYSTARNPAATLRAAHSGIKALGHKLKTRFGKPRPVEMSAMEGPGLDTLADRFAELDGEELEQFESLVYAALDFEGVESLEDATEVAEEVMAGDEPVQLAAAHSPTGGITIGGKEFKGGEFIPAEDVAKASEIEKQQLAGEVGEAASGGFSDARLEGKGKAFKITLADGSPLPSHLEALRLPPAWKHVKINLDPDAALVATGFDAKGRKQSVYSASHTASQAAKKFERIRELQGKFDGIKSQNEKALTGLNKEEAAVMALIMATGIRPGSETDTKADKQAFGATTLQGQHVVIAGDGSVSLEFVGKKGVSLSVPIRDDFVAKALRDRKQKAGEDGQLFATTDTRLRIYAKTLNGGLFKPKDFRTHKGTSLAASLVAQKECCQNEGEYKKNVREVAIAVSQSLGNTPIVALQSYIDPTVFSKWRVA